MTLIALHNNNYSKYNALLNIVNDLKKRRQEVPSDMLARLNAAHEAYQATLAEFNRLVRGRK